MLQDLHNPLTQRRRKTLKDQVRIALTDRPATAPGNVMAQHHIVERKQRRRPVREMRDCERRRGTTVLMEEDEVTGTSGVA